MKVSAAYFIKLGHGGEWADNCLDTGKLRLGYAEIPHHLCDEARWGEVLTIAQGLGSGNSGAAKRHTMQVRAFYEADDSSIFVTFHGSSMFWCQPKGPVVLRDDGTRERETSSGWSHKSIGGKPLAKDRLSGNLTKVEGFRGTICQVGGLDYLVRKLTDCVQPVVEHADKAEAELLLSIREMMKLLTWRDFEILIDLVFVSSGWRRTSTVGATQKTVDFELMLPSTGERAFVQVKSQATDASLNSYVEKRQSMVGFDRMFFAWHSGSVTQEAQSDVTLLGPDKLSRMVLDTGLWTWLRNKVG